MTIPAIETQYNGYTFRSRLEARWAAFFDLMSWRWEYEPFDANGYIPDFVLLGDDSVLVEIKPAVSLRDLVAPLKRAAESTRYEVWEKDILAVGVTPLLPLDHDFMTMHVGHSSSVLGLLYQSPFTRDWDYGSIDEVVEDFGAACWIRCRLCHSPSFTHSIMSYRSRLCGHGSGDHYLGDLPASEIAPAWAAATNAVRWIPKKGHA